jgi:hypothetical protein
VKGDAHDGDAARNDRDGCVEEELMTPAHAPNVALLQCSRVLPRE